MKGMTFALAATFLAVVCAPAFAAHGSIAANNGYAKNSDSKTIKTYTVARNGADDGKNHDEFDDHGGR